ncbi:PQQ-binding-like beta-propeller repeat protein [Edaphobacter aggregans]|uniref:outer membrane protein assembly factor BamB family protein n=1 Tax=Edaphobacter aggregans TaxID=570835 RepID=UPI001B807A16|nr:PQQ-binding-like beta-propeller repeat protein [Edaphobacter aggregans]
MQMPTKNRDVSLPMTALICVLLLVSALSAQSQSDVSLSGQWQEAGQDLNNTRSQPAEYSIGPANVKGLKPKWVFKASGDVSATPTVADDAVYFPDWGGHLFAVNKDSGQVIWNHKISAYDSVAGSVSRVSPVVDHDQLIIGDILSSQVHDGANVISVDRETGELRWITHVDSHPAAIITGSPVVFDGVVYVGVSSLEEGLATNLDYPCCSFRGSVVALNAKTGQMLWKTYDMPENGGQPGGYSGGAVWQPPAIDPKRGLLFVGTGNNYTVPAAVEACQNADPTANCAAADDFFDTALALDLKTGQIKWAKRLQGFDTWTVACLRPPGTNPNCPVPTSPDFDFGGAGPNFLGNIIGFGQKSGIYWALDPDTGNIVWSTPVGPGGTGIGWGTATDGKRIYVEIANNGHLPYTLVPSGQQIAWGSWSALDVATGKILWQTADPTVGTIDIGSVSVANGVMYAGSYSGQMYALDTKTGTILWNFASGGSVIDGPSIVDGVVYWGSGYRRMAGIGNNKVYAFTVAGSTIEAGTGTEK